MTPTDKINHARVASHHGGRPTPAESERISARIMAAARKLFLRDGFAQTSMDAIAAEIGISKRTLYSIRAIQARPHFSKRLSSML